MLTQNRKYLRKFWAIKWCIRTPDDWLIHIYGGNRRRRASAVITRKLLLISATERMKLEKRINEDTKISLQNMLNSYNRDDVYLAITIMAQLKPTKFKKNV